MFKISLLENLRNKVILGYFSNFSDKSEIVRIIKNQTFILKIEKKIGIKSILFQYNLLQPALFLKVQSILKIRRILHIVKLYTLQREG